MKSCSEFADLIHQGLFIYAECFVIINDPLYVKVSDTPHMEGEIVLTDYARENADECCMIFEREYKNDGKYDYEYYGQCYLSKELTEDLLVQTKPTWDLDDQNVTQRAYAANGAVPIEGLKIIVSTKINQNNFIFFEGSTNESGVIEKIVLPAPKINANNLEAPNKLTYEIKASYLNNDIQKVYRVNIYENIYVVQNISIVPSFNMEKGDV